jgi:hypothetical protein
MCRPYRPKTSVGSCEVWSKISGTKFLKEKLLIVSKWQPCRILSNISWRHIPEERVSPSLSREWADLQCNPVCPSVVLRNGCVEGTTCLHQVLPETWWDGHRNVRDATTSIRRNRVESVQDIWVVFPIQKWPHVHRRWWLLSLTRRVWCITSFFPNARPRIRLSTITVLQRLHDAVRRKRPHKWSPGTWLLHHDNTPCHAALSVREFLAKHSIPVVPHPPYSPDLPPCDFFLFSRLKSTLKGKRFQDVAEIQLNMTRQLQAFPRQAHQTCIEKWKVRWNRCR